MVDSKPKSKIVDSKANDKDIGARWRTWKTRNMDIEEECFEILDDHIDDKSTRAKKLKSKVPIARIIHDVEMNNDEDHIELSDQQRGTTKDRGSASGSNKQRSESEDNRVLVLTKPKSTSMIKGNSAIDGKKASKRSHDDGDK